MKLITHLVAGLLGVAFFAFGLMFLLKLVPTPPPPPADSPTGHFMAALAPTGYLTLVKALEVVGGLLVIIPRTRRAGLLILGPILINILAYHGLVAGEGLFNPLLMVLCAFALFLVFAERDAWLRFTGLRRD